MKKSLLIFILPVFFYGQINNDVTIIKNSALNLIDENSKIEVLADSFIVSEGPLWNSENNELIFSDVRQNKIFTWSESDGIKEYILPSGSTGYAPSFKKGGIGSNGLAFDKIGDIIYVNTEIDELQVFQMSPQLIQILKQSLTTIMVKDLIAQMTYH